VGVTEIKYLESLKRKPLFFVFREGFARKDHFVEYDFDLRGLETVKGNAR